MQRLVSIFAPLFLCARRELATLLLSSAAVVIYFVGIFFLFFFQKKCATQPGDHSTCSGPGEEHRGCGLHRRSHRRLYYFYFYFYFFLPPYIVIPSPPGKISSPRFMILLRLIFLCFTHAKHADPRRGGAPPRFTTPPVIQWLPSPPFARVPLGHAG